MKLKEIVINKNKVVGEAYPTFMIAEVALFHDGSLGNALALVDALSETGVDAVKFQTHIAEFESTPSEQFRVKIFPQDKSRYDYWKRTSFNKEQWILIKNRVEEKGMVFISSPFSIEAAELLNDIGIECWKVGSGEVTNKPLLEYLATTQKPIILSSGMSYLNELEQVAKNLKNKKCEVILLQCTNQYPCPPESLGLEMIVKYKEQFNIHTGLSDHSGMLAPCIAAVAIGAKVLEFHVTWSKKCFGPDVSSSLTVDEITTLVKQVCFLDKASLANYSKDDQTSKMYNIRKLFTKSVVPKVEIKKGEKITIEKLSFKKPGTGISADLVHEVIGKTARKDLEVDELFSLMDLEE